MHDLVWLQQLKTVNDISAIFILIWKTFQSKCIIYGFKKQQAKGELLQLVQCQSWIFTNNVSVSVVNEAGPPAPVISCVDVTEFVHAVDFLHQVADIRCGEQA